LVALSVIEQRYRAVMAVRPACIRPSATCWRQTLITLVALARRVRARAAARSASGFDGHAANRGRPRAP
jgi:hypothetical protein